MPRHLADGADHRSKSCRRAPSPGDDAPAAVDVQQGDQTGPDVGKAADSAEESASEASESASESASSESAAESDGPGGYADTNANADTQFQGEQ